VEVTKLLKPPVRGRSNPAAQGRLKTGHLEEAMIRWQSLFSQWLAVGGCDGESAQDENGSVYSDAARA
jgi:hypothetical protein